MTASEVTQTLYVRPLLLDAQPAPITMTGPIGWLRANLFSSPLNTALTLLGILLVAWVVPPFAKFLVIDATWTGVDREACLASATRPEAGACWPFVRERFAYFIYGSYPIAQRWRVDVFFALLAVGVVWLLWLKAPRRDLGTIYAFVVLPIVSFILLRGWPLLGLPTVETDYWGGAMVTIVVAAVGIAVSLPIGILLALGRRSRMPAVKLLSVVYIEFVRGVPLITVLFMASVMLPLFVPDAWSPAKMMRALVGIAMFASAYMAEVVRAGLQAIPKGQYEGAMAVGLNYRQMMRLVVLPQALKITIPNIVNTYIGLFKDTTLVSIVGMFDLLRTIEAARIDPKWATPVTSATGYVFAAMFYFTFCYMMARYARYTEARLARSDRR